MSDYRPTAVEVILDRIIMTDNGLGGERYPPKDALKGTRRFKNFGERSIDLLDFFRHAFRPHVYATTKNEFEQQMRFVFYKIYYTGDSCFNRQNLS